LYPDAEASSKENCVGLCTSFQPIFYGTPILQFAPMAASCLHAFAFAFPTGCPLWAKEAERRLDELEQGLVAEIPAEDVLRRARAAIS
jgi:hypothetical protein